MTDAIHNARAWLDTIGQALAALDRLQRDDTPVVLDGETFDDADALRERIYEMPLAVSVRSDWQTPHDTLTPAEYQILLTTGGPALRIVGELADDGEVETVSLEYQDWGTPWTRFPMSSDEASACLNFASMFFFA